MTAGVVLVFAALLLFFHNRIEDKKAGENAEKTLQQLEDAITEREAKDETDTTRAPDVSSSPGMPSPAGTGSGSNGLPAPPALDMPTVRSGAYDYIGYLDFPGYGLTMPVAATWSFPALEISPCRHAGSVYNDNLVVAGHKFWRSVRASAGRHRNIYGCGRERIYLYRAGTDKRFPGRFGRRDEQRLRTYALHLQLGHDGARHRLL